MSRLTGLLRALPRLPMVLRTLRHLRPEQARAQLHHMLFGLPRPRPHAGPIPEPSRLRSQPAFLPPSPHVRADTASPGSQASTDPPTRGGGPWQVVLLERSLALDPASPDGIDWAGQPHGPLVAYHWHQHEYLRLAAFAPDERARILESWIAGHPAGIGWDPHPISLRLFCWGKLLLEAGALPDSAALRARLHASLADQAETLAAGIEVRLQANHLLTNLMGLVFAGLVFEGAAADRWLGHADWLGRELAAQVHPDGGHEERSPMYHALLLENLLDLLNLARASSRAKADWIDAWRTTAERMLRALAVYTRPDGDLALLADSGLAVAQPPARLVDYARRVGALAAEGAAVGSGGSIHLPQSGYLRLRAGDWDLIASVAGPAPPHQPGHAHCDALAFELSLANARLVCDTGLYDYRPGTRRDQARATAGHATLQFDGREQAELWAAHRIGARPEVALLAWDGAGVAQAACRGYGRGAPRQLRSFAVDDECVTIVDRVEDDCGEVVSRWPLHPDWRVELAGSRARLVHAGGARVEIELPDAFEWAVCRMDYFPTFHVATERAVLVGRRRGPFEARLRLRRLA